MKNLMLILAVVTGGFGLSANPVVVPESVMTGENVLVGVSPEGISVVGNYRFHVVPDLVSPQGKLMYLMTVRLPIPIPDGAKIQDLMVQASPQMIFRGVVFKPDDAPQKFTDLPPIDGVKFMAVTFHLGAVEVPEFEVTIKYTQPVVYRDGRLWAYYIPLMDGFADYKAALGLKADSYVVSFEAYHGSSLVLKSKTAKVLQAAPRLISVRAEDRNVIAVEIITEKAKEPKSLGETGSR